MTVLERYTAGTTAAILVIAIAGCSGSGTSVPQTPLQNGIGASASQSKAESASETQAAAFRLYYKSGRGDLLYVGNRGNNSITVYRHNVSGNTAPLYVISGSHTGIDSPGQLSGDSQGDLYIVNSGGIPAILVFAHGANGNVAPIRTVKGPATGINMIGA